MEVNELEVSLGRALGQEILTTRVRECLKLCADAHDGQYRDAGPCAPNEPVPYILHPVSVAIIAAQHFHGTELPDNLETVVLASIAHDVLEDTTLTARQLALVAGDRVAQLATILTKPEIFANETSAERNARFKENISAGGPTSMYIKVCDSLHNLSKPEISPPRLIEKAVQKAKQDYLRFFDDSLTAISLKESYIHDIEKAESYLDFALSTSESADAKSFEQLATRSYEVGQNKAFEVHDVVSFLRVNLSDIPVRSYSMSHLAAVVSGSRGEGKKYPKIPENVLKNGALELATAPKILRNLETFAECDFLYIFDIGDLLNLRDHQYLFIGRPRSLAPEWLTYECLSIVVGQLTRKARDINATRMDSMVASAHELGLHVTKEQLVATDCNYSDLVNLREVIHFAEFSTRALVSYFDYFVAGNGLDGLAGGIESRVKSPSSILMKLARRGIQDASTIDDLIGLRMLTVDAATADRLVKHCLNGLIDCPICVVTDIDSRVVCSSIGYKARHIFFRVAASGKHIRPVGGELQIRSLSEDAWARISDELQYKNPSSRRATDRILKVLSKLRDEADNALAEFGEESRK